MKHKIQWLNLPGYKGETWNPIIGCSKVSDGCKNCYAEKMAARVYHCTSNRDNSATFLNYSDVLTDDLKWNNNTRFIPESLTIPSQWRQPRIVFVCSMGDLFHESASFQQISAVFSVMADCDQHIFIVLTKRPERLVQFAEWKSWANDVQNIPWRPSANVWLGVTAENQEQAMIRIPYLISIPAAVKFVSIEPMLSQVDLDDTLQYTLKHHAGGLKNCLSWVICGGESGHNARPLHPDWVRSLRNQCQDSGAPFFFKQWGEWMPHGTIRNYNFLNPKKEKVAGVDVMVKVGKHRSGNLLDGVKYEEYPIINL
jgi:protein gp37